MIKRCRRLTRAKQTRSRMSRSGGGRSRWLELTLLLVWLVGCCAGASRLYPITSSLDIVTGVGQGSNDSASTPADDDDEEESGNGTMRCDDARLRCAYRTGCGRALQHYLTRCAAVLHGDVNECPEDCQHALIGLTSSDEGKELMTCNCMKDDTMCKLSKQRVDAICRASVTTTMKRPRVSCRVATWICNADALCSTALQYYNENCKRMFHGKKCTKRCRNSINILRRQEKAARLNTCFCDGAEEYDCNAIHRNMDELCFNKPAQHHNYQEQQLGSNLRNGSSGAYDSDDDPSLNKIPNKAAATLSRSASWRILLLGLVLMLRSAAG